MERARIARVMSRSPLARYPLGAGAQHLVWIRAATLRWFGESRTYPTFHVTCQMKTRLTTPPVAPRIRLHVTRPVGCTPRRDRPTAAREPRRASIPDGARPDPEPGLLTRIEAQCGA